MTHNTIDYIKYKKRMVLQGTSLTAEIEEPMDYSYTDLDGKRVKNIEPSCMYIYHSPAYFEQDKFMVHIKNRTKLREYIAMLQDLDEKFGNILDDVENVRTES